MAKTYEEIKNGASIFVIATKALEAIAVSGINDCEDEKMGQFLARMAIPSFVLGAFSCELILKALVVKAQGDVSNTHKLNDLYHMVDEPTRDAIANTVISKMKVHNSNYGMDNFLADLDGVANVFIDWRYFYEDSRSLDVTFFGEFFDVLISYTTTSENR